MKIQFELDVSSYGTLDIYGQHAAKARDLYRKWQLTGHDDDFEELTDFLAEDVASNIEFWVTELKVVSD
jgi:hypothetical protein